MKYVVPFVSLSAAVLGVALITHSGLATSAAPQSATPSDSSKLPDIVGVHLGMTIEQARAAFQKAYSSPIQPSQLGYGPGNRQQAVIFFRTNTPSPESAMAVDVTLPPNPQVVWHGGRRAAQPNVNRAVMLTALRQKYGKETVAISDATRRPTTNDSDIAYMYWVMDEQGQLMSGMPPMIQGSPFGCIFNWGPDGKQPPSIAIALSDYCGNKFVGIYAELAGQEIINMTEIDLVDYPLLTHSVAATDAFTKGLNQQIQQQEQQKSQGIKPAI